MKISLKPSVVLHVVADAVGERPAAGLTLAVRRSTLNLQRLESKSRIIDEITMYLWRVFGLLPKKKSF